MTRYAVEKSEVVGGRDAWLVLKRGAGFDGTARAIIARCSSEGEARSLACRLEFKHAVACQGRSGAAF